MKTNPSQKISIFETLTLLCFFAVFWVSLASCNNKGPMGMQVVMEDITTSVAPNRINLELVGSINQTSYVFEAIHVLSLLDTPKEDLWYSWAYTFDTRNPASDDAEHFTCTMTKLKGSSAMTPFDLSSDPRCLDQNMLIEPNTRGYAPRFKSGNHYPYDIQACVRFSDLDGKDSELACALVQPRFNGHRMGGLDVIQHPEDPNQMHADVSMDFTKKVTVLGNTHATSSSIDGGGTFDTFTYRWNFHIEMYDEGQNLISFTCRPNGRIQGRRILSGEPLYETPEHEVPSFSKDEPWLTEPGQCNGFTMHGQGNHAGIRTPLFDIQSSEAQTLRISTCAQFRDGWFDSTSGQTGCIFTYPFANEIDG